MYLEFYASHLILAKRLRSNGVLCFRVGLGVPESHEVSCIAFTRLYLGVGFAEFMTWGLWVPYYGTAEICTYLHLGFLRIVWAGPTEFSIPS